jgi:ABC-type lipoprotein export system ATPase subunit
LTDAALECEGLHYDRDGFELFNGLTFRLEMGQAGIVVSDPQLKARRLLQISSTVREPTHGKVKLFGRDATGLPQDAILELRRRIGYVHRESRLVSNMTLLDNIVLGLIYHRNISHREAEDGMSDLLNRFGLYPFRHRRPAEVSYSMQRRTLYLRELAKKPGLFLLEAPVLDLDQNFENMLEILKDVLSRREAALLLSDVTGRMVLDLIDWVLILEPDGYKIKTVDEFDQSIYRKFLMECRSTGE